MLVLRDTSCPLSKNANYAPSQNCHPDRSASVSESEPTHAVEGPWVGSASPFFIPSRERSLINFVVCESANYLTMTD